MKNGIAATVCAILLGICIYDTANAIVIGNGPDSLYTGFANAAPNASVGQIQGTDGAGASVASGAMIASD